jgi:hypothetical protein
MISGYPRGATLHPLKRRDRHATAAFANSRGIVLDEAARKLRIKRPRL